MSRAKLACFLFFVSAIFSGARLASAQQTARLQISYMLSSATANEYFFIPADNAVVTRTDPGTITVTDISTGSVLKQFELEGTLLGADNNLLYVKKAPQRLDAIDVRNGDTRWRYFAESTFSILDLDVISTEAIVFLSIRSIQSWSREDYLLAIDKISGNPIWRTDSRNTIHLSGDTLVTAQQEGTILPFVGGIVTFKGYSVSTGSPIWEVSAFASENTTIIANSIILRRQTDTDGGGLGCQKHSCWRSTLDLAVFRGCTNYFQV